MEEPGGEMDVSDRRLCCEIPTDRKSQEIQSLFTTRLSFYFNIFLSSPLTLSLLSALAACLHSGCHTSHPKKRKRERERGIFGVGCSHMASSVYASV